MGRMFFLRVSTACSQLSFYVVSAAVMNKRSCKCPQSKLVAGVHCGSSTVISSSPIHGTREIFGWNMTKVCSFLTLHETRLSLFNAERFDALASEAYTVRIGKTASLSLSQSCNDPMLFTFGEMIESYGPPLFVQYQVVPLRQPP